MGIFIAALLSLYVLSLFATAWRADRAASGVRSAKIRRVSYALSIAVLCSAWTYFAAIGTATRHGFYYLPHFAGPILMIVLFFGVWRRIATAAKRENVGSIADFISSRYGKSRLVGTLVTVVSTVGALPYIVLQLKILAIAWAIVAGQAEPPTFAIPLIAAILAGFAILFGARRPTLTYHSPGLVQAVAIQSVVKLVALLAVAALGFSLVVHTPSHGYDFSQVRRLVLPIDVNASLFTALLLCMSTTISLPRQFHMAFVELEDLDDLKTARWLFPLYMGLAGLAVPPIVAASSLYLKGLSHGPDMDILALPMAFGGPFLTALAFLGGFSATSAMVISETLALSAMWSNELLARWLTHGRWRSKPIENIGRSIVNIRRIGIAVILLLSASYFLAMRKDDDINILGFTALAASAQLLPSLVGAVVWRRGHAYGALAGITAGMTVWFYSAIFPRLAVPFAWPDWLSPAHVLGPNPKDVFNHGVWLSLALNLLVYVLVSIAAKRRLIDRIQSMAFVGAGQKPSSRLPHLEPQGRIGDLRAIVAQFIGQDDARRAFQELDREEGAHRRDSDPIDPAAASAAERMLTGAIGASSAQRVMLWTLASAGGEGADISRVLDDAAQAVQFGRGLLQTTLDNLSQGVSVVDGELSLVAWNRRFLELFGIKGDQIYVGKPLTEILGSPSLGAMPSSSAAAVTTDVLASVRAREQVCRECDWPDGRIIEFTGAPMAQGDYVISYADVTDLRVAAEALREANERLEERVRRRTQELTETNRALEEAKAVAENATNAQARFLAAASHDLLQPMHAARLFMGSALEDLSPRSALAEIIKKADFSIEAADRMLSALLNLSRLEVGGIKPAIGPVSVYALLNALRREFEPTAAAKGVALRIVPTELAVLSDADLLRSILQNLIGNAIRYTASGGVVVGCRRQGDKIVIEVHDSGSGIAKSDLPLIFKEFTRLPSRLAPSSGAGLGLAIVDRICRLLGHELGVRSALGKGSVFYVTAPRAAQMRAPVPAAKPNALRQSVRVLCVENEALVLASLEMLLQRWGVAFETAARAEDALSLPGPWDVVLADFHLGGELDGLDLLEKLIPRSRVRALITASPSEQTCSRAAEMGVEIIRKPVSPASLRAFLSRPSQLSIGAQQPASRRPRRRDRALAPE
ncbi:MAG TPA: ATP-binding protein [Caulobacteraceae bacterium]|nr:ATP-binding protein [Caulobacteraceae bacterium]